MYGYRSRLGSSARQLYCIWRSACLNRIGLSPTRDSGVCSRCDILIILVFHNCMIIQSSSCDSGRTETPGGPYRIRGGELVVHCRKQRNASSFFNNAIDCQVSECDIRILLKSCPWWLSWSCNAVLVRALRPYEHTARRYLLIINHPLGP